MPPRLQFNLKERVSYLFILRAILTEYLPYAWNCVRCWEYKYEQDMVITIQQMKKKNMQISQQSPMWTMLHTRGEAEMRGSQFFWCEREGPGKSRLHRRGTEEAGCAWSRRKQIYKDRIESSKRVKGSSKGHSGLLLDAQWDKKGGQEARAVSWKALHSLHNLLLKILYWNGSIKTITSNFRILAFTWMLSTSCL